MVGGAPPGPGWTDGSLFAWPPGRPGPKPSETCLPDTAEEAGLQNLGFLGHAVPRKTTSSKSWPCRLTETTGKSPTFSQWKALYLCQFHKQEGGRGSGRGTDEEVWG